MKNITYLLPIFLVLVLTSLFVGLDDSFEKKYLGENDNWYVEVSYTGSYDVVLPGPFVFKPSSKLLKEINIQCKEDSLIENMTTLSVGSQFDPHHGIENESGLKDENLNFISTSTNIDFSHLKNVHSFEVVVNWIDYDLHVEKFKVEIQDTYTTLK